MPAFVLVARARPAHAQQSAAWLDQKLLAAAKKEGPLTVYSSTNEQEGLPLFKIFEDATGIKFNYIRGNDASLISRIAIETRAKQPSFDIVHMTNAHKMPQHCWRSSIRRRRSTSIRWRAIRTGAGTASTPSTRRRPTTPSSYPRPTCRRASRSSRKRKEWAGKVAIDHTDIEWLRGMMQFYGEQKGTALVREIAANLKPVLTDGRLAMARSVAAGEYLLRAQQFRQSHAEREARGRRRSSSSRSIRCRSISRRSRSARSAPNPNTARLAANFMLSRDCQVFYTKFGRLPTRTDVETNPPGIIKQVEVRKVVRTQFSQEEEKRLRQTFETLLRKR